MNARKAFCLYFGLNLHFTQMSYSVITYGTNTKHANAKYDSMSQEQQYRFEWVSSKFTQVQDLVYACIGNQFDDVSMQFGLKDEIRESYLKFKGRREAMTYTIKNDIAKHEMLDFMPIDKLIYKHFVGHISPEYVLLLGHDNNSLKELYDSPNLSWAKPKILKLIKYNDFFNSKKYLPLLNQNETNVAT